MTQKWMELSRPEIITWIRENDPKLSGKGKKAWTLKETRAHYFEHCNIPEDKRQGRGLRATTYNLAHGVVESDPFDQVVQNVRAELEKAKALYDANRLDLDSMSIEDLQNLMTRVNKALGTKVKALSKS